MNRDPHYQRIEDGLKRLSDGNLFERCVADLLRDEHPTLVPVPGGTDAGMDGALIYENEDGLLIATVGKDVIGNVTRNLKSHQDSGGTRTKILVATTQQLTQRRCNNIKNRIKEFGCSLIHYPYTLPAIADRLYHNTRWCRELLGLSHASSALSKLPRIIRAFRDLKSIGRDDDASWIRTQPGDRLIVGQPGIGKTFLLQKLADDGHGLFLIDDDRNKIDEAIQDQSPSAIVVEDVHFRTETLEYLIRRREESGAAYAIIADTWPARASDIQAILGLNDNNVLKLKKLNDKLIVRIINEAGIYGPNELMHQMVRQSLGLPGRATLLAQACISGGISEVWTGETLNRLVSYTVNRLVGADALQVLAGFAMGGKFGFKIDDVAQLLEIGAADIRKCIVELSASGVVHEVDSSMVAVFPGPLRSVLVRDHFFRNLAPLPFQKFIDRAPNLGEAVVTTIQAKALGAQVSTHELLKLIERTDSRDAWNAFAWADRQHAEIIISQYPEMVIELSEALIHQIPQRSIPIILSILDSKGETDSHSLAEIKNWIKTAIPGEGEATTRRRTLAQIIENWLISGKNVDVGLQLLPWALRTGFEDHQQEPGNWRSVTIRHGPLLLDELRNVAQLWHPLYLAMQKVEIGNWCPVLEAIDEWIYSARFTVELSQEYNDYFDEVSRRMLVDIAAITSKRPGVLTELKKRASHIDFELAVDDCEPTFHIVFPQEPRLEDWREREKHQTDAARDLATTWSKESPDSVGTKLAILVREAKDAGITYPDFSEFVCRLIAEKVCTAIPWIDAFIDHSVSQKCARPFFQKAIENGETNLEQRAISCLRNSNYEPLGLSILLQTPGLSDELSVELMESAKKFPNVIEFDCQCGSVIDDYLITLLNHTSADVAEAAAIGIWHCDSENSIAPFLADAWEQAVIAHVSKEYELCRIFETNHELAFRWLLDRGTTDKLRYHSEDNVIASAASLISSEQKRQVLEQSADVHNARFIVRFLIGNDEVLYRKFLTDQSRKHLHLEPVTGSPDETWAKLAIVALDAGYSVQEVAYRAQSRGGFAWGSTSSKYEKQADEWSTLLMHHDPRIRQAAELGKDENLRQAKKWKLDEQREEDVESYLE